jgi:hypothetical protein
VHHPYHSHHHHDDVIIKYPYLEPLAAHARSHEAHRSELARLVLAPDLDLNLVHLGLEQAAREVGLM